MSLRLTAIATLLGGCWLLAAQSEPQIKKTTATATSPASGKEMYLQYCATCHGKDGKGGGPAVAALKVAPTNLTTLTAGNQGTFPALRISRVIEGSDNQPAHGSRDMPIWGEVFHRMDGAGPSTMKLRVGNLTDYIKSIQAK